MALTINTNIKNDADGYLIDAKNVKGTYVVVDSYEDLANLPSECVVRGSLAFCTGQATMYIYDYTDSWYSLGEIKGSPHTININSSFDVSQTYTFTFQWLTHDWEAATFNTNIYFSDGTVISFGENGTANSSSGNGSLSMIVVYQNKQYLASLTINLASQSNNATLSFQELQAGSGGGGGSTTITPELYTFTFISLMAGPLFLYMTASQYNQLVQALSQAGYTISSPSDIENLYNNGTLLERLTGLGAISLYKMGGSVDGDLLAGYEIDQNTGSITVKYFGNDGTLNTSTCTAQDVNASTLSIDYVSQTISGSSGEGGSVELKSNVYTLKFSSNNTYEYTDSNEETQTTELPMIWGITFEAKDIVNRFNAVIDEFNSISGTSIAHITSENEIATTIKQIITMMIAGSMNNIQFNALFSNMLVYLANGEEETSEELYSNSLNKLYRTFGTTKGSTGDGILENSFLANTPIAIVYGMFGSAELVQLDIENTGDYTKFCLKDTYELELINETPFEASGSGSGSSDQVSGGSGKLYEINMQLTRYDENGDQVGFGNLSGEELGLGYNHNQDYTLDLTLDIYESNFENIKTKLNTLIDLYNQLTGLSIPHLTDINSLVSFINSKLVEEVADGDASGFVFLNEIIPLCDNAYYKDASSTPTPHKYNIIGVNTFGWTIGYYGNNKLDGVKSMFSVNDDDRYYALNVHNSCTLTEYGTSGSGSGGGTATKKWYDFTFITSQTETINQGQQDEFDNVITDKIKAKLSETDYNELINELSDAGLTISSYQELITLFNNYKASNPQACLLVIGMIIKLASNSNSTCYWERQESQPNYGDSPIANTYYVTKLEEDSLIPEPYTNSTSWFGTGNFEVISSSTVTVTEETETISGSGGEAVEPSIPERFSIAQNLVVNMNGEQYKPNQANWSGSNSDNIRQFKVGSSVAGLTDIQALLSHLTGNPTYDVYNATKPTPCFVFCTESNICWKLQYDGETNGLRAYKVVNFPFVVKENRYYWHIMSSNDNRLTFWMNESAMQYLINAINTIMPTVNPSWANITDYNGVEDLFNTLKVNAADPGIFVLITTLLGSGGYVIKDNTSYGEKTPIYFTKIDNGYAETREVTGVRVESSSNMITYVDPFGVLGNSIITNDSSQASDGVYIDSNAAIIISKQR